MQLVILDRDGVINYDSDDYIKSPDEWQAIPNSLEAIVTLNQAGFRVVIATNQSGLARGFFSIDTLNKIHAKMYRELAALGGNIEAIFFCPHSPRGTCNCRKPKPGLYNEIGQRLGIHLTGVPAIGDSLRDIQAAAAAGAVPMLVRTGKGLKTEAQLPQNGFEHIQIYDDLAAAAQFIVEQQQLKQDKQDKSC
ncbi:MAG: D-glycero-beta-D-manno-heptose 1,7-bisphosphate 7-phosphatase [Pseudomonadota bacterium]